MPVKQIEIVTGSEILSRAAMDAGVNFFAGYPITPASSVYSAMLSKLQAEAKLALGVSDEISGLAMCIGAAMRGAKSMTATSAPGLSLMVESIGYAFATETPVLIVLGQRMGPSTGAATQSAEGDISFVAHLISGGYQIPVFAVNSIANCYETTIRAINISEKYRTPVILLSEKDILMSAQNIDTSKLPKCEIIDRKYFAADSDKVYKTYDFDALSDVPDFVQAGANEHRVVVTASTHDKSGTLSKNSPEAMAVTQHLESKILENLDDMTFYEQDFDLGQDQDLLAETTAANQEKPAVAEEKVITVLSFLATDLAAREAIKRARADGIKINHLTLFTLFPIPKKLLRNTFANAKAVVVPEENMTGQYAEMIANLLFDANEQRIPLHKVNKLAALIAPDEIYQAIKEAI